MKKLDWYILRKFLGTFVFIMALLLCITVVIDVQEKIDAFVTNHAPFKAIVLDYFVYFLPWITSMIGPFFVLVAVIFFTSQLAERSEIVAILNSGTSFYRLLYPYFLGATILALAFYVGNNYFVPFSNEKRLEFERKYVYKPPEWIHYNFHRTIAPGTVIYMEGYKPKDGTANKFGVDKFKDGRLVYKIRSEKVEWLKETKKWRLNKYYTREFRDNGDLITKGEFMDTTFSFTPIDFSYTENQKETMTTPQLKEYIQYLYQAGQPNIEYFEIELYRRTSSAFSIYLMTLIGVSVASRKVRGGLGWHLVIGIALSALYEMTMKFSTTFSTNSSLPPILGVWIPNFIYAAIGLYLLKRAPK
ncbi:MAG: LptF/LptG family permease [Bacteroidetes bacterium]|nr:LptF/LptG family permease [Bacteroidota bacterium]